MLVMSVCGVLVTTMLLISNNLKEWERFYEKNKIPKDSFWRKLYPFKKEPTGGLLYITFIPALISMLILFVVLIIYVIYWIKPEVLSGFLESKTSLYISLGYAGLFVIHMGVARWR